MARGRRLLRQAWLTALVAVALAACACGQSQPTSASTGEWELPPDVRAALAQTQDFAFNFDQPGFYAVLEFVKRNPYSPGFSQTPILVADWRDLLERPGDFRGRPVTLEGQVGRNKAPYTLESRPDLGQLWQLELRRPDQPLTCTLILTEKAADIPLDATITVTGYFIMIRQYHGRAGRIQPAALVVAPGPTGTEQRGRRSAAATAPDWRWMAGAIVLGLVITLILLYWSGRAGRREYGTLRASHEAPVSLADDLDEWAQSERPGSKTDWPEGQTKTGGGETSRRG
jgi:hypothetical protein